MAPSIASPDRLASLALGTALLITPALAFTAEDLNCMHRAIDDRAEELRDAYERYANDMNDTINRFSDREHDAIDVDEGYSRQNDIARAMNEFNYQAHDMWQRLTMNLRYVWDNYYQRRSQCGFGSVAPGSYGGNYYISNYNYSYGYGRYGNLAAHCSQPVLQAPPAGCGYECAPDSNGCQRCHLACRSAVSYSSCGCTPTYDPVCTRDGRTYDNACIAVCSGREVLYDGACR